MASIVSGAGDVYHKVVDYVAFVSDSYNQHTTSCECQLTPEYTHKPNGWELVYSDGYSPGQLSAVKLWKHDTQGWCVAFKGSQTVAEWVSNVDIGDFVGGKPAIRLEDNDLFEGKVHRGFLNGYREFRRNIIDKINENGGCTKVTLCGHSRGGAIAYIAAVDFATVFDLDKESISTITIGAPAVGDRAFRSMYEEKVGFSYRMVNYLDPVPRLFDLVKALTGEVCVHVCGCIILDYGVWEASLEAGIDLAKEKRTELMERIKGVIAIAGKYHMRPKYLSNLYENRSKIACYVKLGMKLAKANKIDWEKVKSGLQIATRKGGKVLTTGGSSAMSANSTGGSSLMSAPQLGWLNLAVNVAGHVATNVHIYKMWNAMDQHFGVIENQLANMDGRFDGIENQLASINDVLEDVDSAIQGAEKRLTEQIDNLKAQVAEESQNIRDTIREEFDNMLTDKVLSDVSRSNVITSMLRNVRFRILIDEIDWVGFAKSLRETWHF